MFQRIAGFFRRLFSSKAFRRGLRIFFWVFVVYYLYNITLFIIAMKNSGGSIGDALRIIFITPLIDLGHLRPSASVALGIAAGLIWFFNRRERNRNDKSEEKTEESPESVREEEFIEPEHYMHQERM